MRTFNISRHVCCLQRQAAMMMIAFITFKSSLVPLLEGLWSSISWEFEVSGFRRNRTDDLGIDNTTNKSPLEIHD